MTALYGRDARGPITGVTLLAGFASTVGWPLTTLFDGNFGWRGACLAWAALHLVLGLPLNRVLVPRGLRSPANEASLETQPIATPSRAMTLLAFVFASTWIVSTGMAAHLPRLLQTAGASATGAVTAAAFLGPAQVAARLVEFGLMRRTSPLVSARVATLLHPAGALALAVFGGPAAAVFTVLHGAGNGMLTIAKGTLPLAIFGPAGYGLRTGLLSAPARVAQAGAPLLFGLLLDEVGLGVLALSASLGLASTIALTACHHLRQGTGWAGKGDEGAASIALRSSRRAPLIRAATSDVPNPLDHGGCLGIEFTRPGDRLSLRRENGASAFRVGATHRVVALGTSFHEQLILAHAYPSVRRRPSMSQ